VPDKENKGKMITAKIRDLGKTEVENYKMKGSEKERKKERKTKERKKKEKIRITIKRQRK
jgi:hypothetical protein